MLFLFIIIVIYIFSMERGSNDSICIRLQNSEKVIAFFCYNSFEDGVCILQIGTKMVIGRTEITLCFLKSFLKNDPL